MGFTEEYLRELKETLDRLPSSQLERIKDILLTAYREDKKVFIMGNGGSAATASHFACDLAKGTHVDGKKRFRVISLTDNIPLIMAWSNDTDYDNVFVGQLKNLMQPGDVVIGISGSGNSPNVLNAMDYGNSNGAVTVGFTGFSGGKIKDMASICLVVPIHSMEHIEDVHLALEHLVCTYLRSLLRDAQVPE